MVELSGRGFGLLTCIISLLSITPLDSVRLRSLTVPDSGACNRTIDGSHSHTGDSSLTALRPPPITRNMRGSKIYCTYSFHAARTQRIMLNIRTINLGQFDALKNRCVYAFLRLWDGLSVAGRHLHPPNTLCGRNSSLPLWKFSTGRDLMVEYQADHARGYMDFNLQYRFIDMVKDAPTYPDQLTHDMKPTVNSSSLCDWTIVLEDCQGNCEILSPEYPGMYPPNIECVYRVVSRSSHTNMLLRFQGNTDEGKMRSFHVRPSDRCTKDYLMIQDNQAPEGSRDIAQFCGDKTYDIRTTGNNITLRFRSSDEKYPFGYNGFHLSVIGFTEEWDSLSSHVAGSLCDWDFSSGGSVFTPDHWLPPGAKCTYSFYLDPGYVLKLRLNVYGLRSDCRDEILIYEADRLTQRLCDGNLPRGKDEDEPLTIKASSPVVRIVYKTAEGQFQGHSHQGFFMSFQQHMSDKTQEYPMKDQNREEFLTSLVESHDQSDDHSSANEIVLMSTFAYIMLGFWSQLFLVRFKLLQIT